MEMGLKFVTMGRNGGKADSHPSTPPLSMCCVTHITFYNLRCFRRVKRQEHTPKCYSTYCKHLGNRVVGVVSISHCQQVIAIIAYRPNLTNGQLLNSMCAAGIRLRGEMVMTWRAA